MARAVFVGLGRHYESFFPAKYQLRCTYGDAADKPRKLPLRWVAIKLRFGSRFLPLQTYLRVLPAWMHHHCGEGPHWSHAPSIRKAPGLADGYRNRCLKFSIDDVGSGLHYLNTVPSVLPRVRH